MAVVVQRDVLGERELEHEAAPLAVLGDVAHAGVEHLARGVVRDVLAVDLDSAAGRVPQAGERLDQLALAVAVDAGEPDDLPRPHLERDAAHRLEPAVVLDVQVLDAEQRLARLGRRLLDAQQHLAPDHQPARAPPRSRPRAGRSRSACPRRSTEIRSAISSTSFSLWLMKMTDVPCSVRLRDDLEQLVRLLRGQHGGRLVEDQHLGAAVERLQDLDPLLLADRDVLDLRARVDREPEPLRELAHPARRRRRSRAGRRRSSARWRGRCSRPPSSPGSA